MIRPQSLGRLVAWTVADQRGYLRMRYLMPRVIETALFLALPKSRIRVHGDQVHASVQVDGQHIWLEATLGQRELTVNFEKIGGRVPFELVSWFEMGLEEFTGCNTLQAPPSQDLRRSLHLAA
ncbi:MAG: hypothetical protein VX899_15505 [Myxococcota bacterium]|nr:hypothetical protein [Myxococcota bacterium]